MNTETLCKLNKIVSDTTQIIDTWENNLHRREFVHAQVAKFRETFDQSEREQVLAMIGYGFAAIDILTEIDTIIGMLFAMKVHTSNEVFRVTLLEWDTVKARQREFVSQYTAAKLAQVEGMPAHTQADYR